MDMIWNIIKSKDKSKLKGLGVNNNNNIYFIIFIKKIDLKYKE